MNLQDDFVAFCYQTLRCTEVVVFTLMLSVACKEHFQPFWGYTPAVIRFQAPKITLDTEPPKSYSIVDSG
jgi:hypothetical protein